METPIGGRSPENLSRWQRLADEAGMPLWDWVALACETFETQYQPSLRFENDLKRIPPEERDAWASKHAQDERYQVSAPLHF